MLTVHHLRLSQSERIVWLCEEMGIDYDLKLYNRREDNNLAPDEYKALHPMGIAPVITDGNFVLGESGAIFDWLVAQYGDRGLFPAKESPDFANHLFFLHWANATFMTNGMMALVAGRMLQAEIPPFVADRMAKSWAIIEQRLGEAEYFGGSQLTTADIMMGFQLTTSRAMSGMGIDGMPNLQAYLKRIGERPAYQQAMAKAEPGMPPKLD
ncbi:MAG: glutathione S-transferase family protein [Sphingomonadaceae bacterium]|nr:glutathione S-transferase family protein [Sphingomonadaceae bacterium]MCP5383482.1 glutathione S-transferase family protein [Altererythrobacter sp.]MCP5391487.1 glutathione S-transferase family protein [Sphingomonadaceae bacterium]MCP5394424.1 glutathione S-transferase family protein [Sphingomonadaceae bacterium]